MPFGLGKTPDQAGLKGVGVVQHQTFHFIKCIFYCVTGGLEVTFGGVHELLGHTVEQFRAPLFKHREQFFFDGGANRLDTEFVFTRLGKRALYKLLDERDALNCCAGSSRWH